MVFGMAIPAVSGVCVIGVERLAGLSEMLTGMIPVDNLHTVGEQIRRQVPNPGRPIGGHAAFSSLRHLSGYRRRP
jgi:hypothetical protein